MNGLHAWGDVIGWDGGGDGHLSALGVGRIAKGLLLATLLLLRGECAARAGWIANTRARRRCCDFMVVDPNRRAATKVVFMQYQYIRTRARESCAFEAQVPM